MPYIQLIYGFGTSKSGNVVTSFTDSRGLKAPIYNGDTNFILLVYQSLNGYIGAPISIRNPFLKILAKNTILDKLV